MIASRALRIFGSGTSSTRTCFLPVQQFARMEIPPLRSTPLRFRRTRRVQARMNARVRVHHLAGLEDLLQAAQVAFDLLARFLADQLREARAEEPGRRAVLQLELDLRAAAARCRQEANDARVGN